MPGYVSIYMWVIISTLIHYQIHSVMVSYMGLKIV